MALSDEGGYVGGRVRIVNREQRAELARLKNEIDHLTARWEGLKAWLAVNNDQIQPGTVRLAMERMERKTIGRIEMMEILLGKDWARSMGCSDD